MNMKPNINNGIKFTQDNLDQTLQFLNKFAPDRDTWTFQTFDDNAGRKDRTLAKIYNGTLTQHYESLKLLNQKGAGVFVTVNQTDGTGRKAENIVSVDAVWIEDDEGTAKSPLEPHIVVESSPKKYHNYFLLENASKQDFQRIQEALVANWGSDPNAKDISRVLRLPGFYHQKVNTKKGLNGEPWLVKVIGGLRYAE